MSSWIALFIGCAAGVAITGTLVLWLMRTRMVVPHRSQGSFEETCAAIERVVPAHKGWGFPIETWNFYRTLESKELVPEGIRKLKVFFVCNAGYAQQVLSDTPAMAGIMPCSWAVYELEDGSVWVSKMNIGLMARMFGGRIRRVMRQVAAADERFLAEVLAGNQGRARREGTA